MSAGYRRPIRIALRQRKWLHSVACGLALTKTTHDAPTYEVDGIIHYGVANMPGAVPVTSSHALNHATLPFGLALAAEGARALRANKHLRNGLNIHCGKLTCEPVAQALKMQAVPAQALFA